MKINFTTKFSSVDELPSNIREIYEQTLANGSGVLSSRPKVSTRIVVNGHEVESTKELSEAEQKLYGDVLQLLKGAGATTGATVTPALSASITAESPPPVKTGWLTKKQWNFVLMVIVLTAIALLIALDPEAFLP